MSETNNINEKTGRENMRIYHTSSEQITEINEDGLFNDCLFFSHDVYSLGSYTHVYAIDIEEEEIINVSQLHDTDIIAHIASVLECDTETAESILDGSIPSVCDIDADPELDWFIQAQQGECANVMGYKACRSTDEQGTVFIVAMFGREKELIEIEE